MREHAQENDEEEINMTPMLDIVFIMLIFFIVTASFVQENGLEVNQPDSSQTPPDDQDDTKKNVMISVDNSNRIRVNFRLVDIRRVRANIERLYAENPDGSVVIQAYANAYTGLIVDIYDQALSARIPRGKISVIQKK